MTTLRLSPYRSLSSIRKCTGDRPRQRPGPYRVLQIVQDTPGSRHLPVSSSSSFSLALERKRLNFLHGFIQPWPFVCNIVLCLSRPSSSPPPPRSIGHSCWRTIPDSLSHGHCSLSFFSFAPLMQPRLCGEAG